MRTNGNTREYKPTISGTITLSDRTTVSLTNSDFMVNSLCIRTGTNSTVEFGPGGAVIGDIDFILINDTGRFDNIDWYDSTVELTLTANNVAVQIGKHWIVNHKETGSLIQVECHDILKVLDQFTVRDIMFPFPCTIGTALNKIQTFPIASLNNQSLNAVYGLTFSTTAIQSFLNTQIIDPGDSTPLRAFLSYIAQICGKYVKANGTTLSFGWYDMTSTYDAGTTFSHELKTDDLIYQSVKITGPDGGMAQARVGTRTSGLTYELTASDNPLITEDNMLTVSQTIAAAFDGIAYRPGSATIVSDIALEAGDVITLATGQEQNIKFLLMSVTYKPQLTESVSGAGVDYDGDMRKTSSSFARQTAQDAVDAALSGLNAGLQLLHVAAKTKSFTWSASSHNSRFWNMNEDGTITQWYPSGGNGLSRQYGYTVYEQDIQVPYRSVVQSYADSRGANISTIYFQVRFLINICGCKGYIDVWAAWDATSTYRINFFNSGVYTNDPYRYSIPQKLVPSSSGVPGYGTCAVCIHWTDSFPFTYISLNNQQQWAFGGASSANPSSVSDPLDVAGTLEELTTGSEFQEILVKPKVANYAFSGEEVGCIRVGTYTSSGSADTGVISTLKLTSYTNKQMQISVRETIIRVPTPESIVNSCRRNWASFFVSSGTTPALPTTYADVYGLITNPQTTHNLTFDVEIPVDVLGYSTAVDSGTSVSCWLKYKGYYAQDGKTINLMPVQQFQHCDLGSITDWAMFYMRPVQFDSSRSDYGVTLIPDSDNIYYVDDGN